MLEKLVETYFEEKRRTYSGSTQDSDRDLLHKPSIEGGLRLGWSCSACRHQ